MVPPSAQSVRWDQMRNANEIVVVTPAALASDDGASLLLLRVIAEFRLKGISYCYWKSSRRLAAVLLGEGDVDLLIGRADQHRAQASLLMQGFKLFSSVAGRDHPSIMSFLGHDERNGNLIHLHLHFRLVIGERLFKNYRLPWEESLLQRTTLHPTLPIRIIDPASEALLLVVRACLELRRIDPITLRSWRVITRNSELDRRELAGRVDRAQLGNVARQFLNERLAEMVCDAMNDSRPLESQGRLQRCLRRHLAPYRSYGSGEARLRAAGRAGLWAAGGLNSQIIHLPRPWNRRAPGGGLVVALIGVDGSGKTTVARAIRAWLSSEIDVVPIYFGTGAGRPSLLLRPFKMVVPLISRLMAVKPRGASHGRMSGGPPGVLYSVLLTVWATVVAWEKRTKLLAARRGANRGLVVIADRYPQDEIASFNDGALLSRLKRVPQWLHALEHSAYALASRLPPDLVIKLQVTPETVAVREPEMDHTVIGERVADVRRLKFPGAQIVTVDAEQPLPDVISAVKSEIWRLL
jgi:hypothetical protein